MEEPIRKKTGVCPFMKAPMEQCYCRSLSSENIEKAYDFCSGNYRHCTIYQSVYRPQDAVLAQAEKESCPVIGLFTGRQRLLQLQARQELSLQVLELLESNPSVRNMYRDFIFLLRNFCAVNDITLYVVDGDNHLRQEIVACHGDVVTELVVPKKLDCICGQILKGEVPDQTLSRNDAGVYWTNDRTTLSKEALQGVNACINTCCPNQQEGSLALFPIHYQNRTVGVVRINDPRPELFTRDDIRFLDGLCSAVSVIASRARAARSRVYAEMVVEAFHTPIIVVDRAYVVRKVNAEYLRWTGFSEAEVLGRNLEEVVGGIMFHHACRPLLDRALSGEQVRETTSLSFVERPAVSCDVRCLPHFDSEGRVDAVIIEIHKLQ